MIIEWLLDLVIGVVDWFFGLFDGWEIPDLSPPPEIASLLSFLDGMGVWVPWAVIGVSITAVLGVWGVMFLIKIVRQVLAHVPLFGGSG